MKLDRRTLLKLGALAAAAPVAPAFAAPPAAAPGLPLLGHLPSRARTSLDGPWRYILDPFDVAGRKPKARRNFWEDRQETRETGIIEYEWASSPQMQLPGAWNTAAPELSYYEGPIYFRHTLSAADHPGVRQFLYFEAVNYAATVWLNGQELARHEGGFTPFQVELTGRLGPEPRPHSLVLRADSRHGPETLPALDFDWKNQGGVTRSIWLVETPATHIRDSFVRLEGGRLKAEVWLDGPEAAGQQVRLALPELGFRRTARSDATGCARFEAPIPRGLALWSPERPQLYALEIAAAGDRVTDRIGLRTLATRGRELLLNGQPIFLKGISLHEEAFGPAGARVTQASETRALLAEAKALGCNFVRLAHYPHAEQAARIADELGLLVWAEIPVYWEEVAFESAATLALAKAMLGELIARDRNRASVMFWSVANETPISPARNRFLEALIAHARALDPTRLLTAALNKNVDVGGVRDGESVISVEDPLAEALDVVAINQYEGWYGKRSPGEIANVRFVSRFERPLMFSEFGADALYGHHGPREERWTEEHQAWLYAETLRVVAATPGCVGLSPWVLKDFQSPRRWHGRFQGLWNRKGLVSPEGERKLAWEVLQRFYAQR
jgi:beta-glucuronidase